MDEIHFSRQARKDAKKLAASHLKSQAQALLDIMAMDPFQTPPRHESLCGDLSGCYYRRIRLQHRIVCEVFLEEKNVLILRMWTHYGDSKDTAPSVSSATVSSKLSAMPNSSGPESRPPRDFSKRKFDVNRQ